MSKEAKVLDISGKITDTPDFPIAVIREYTGDENLHEDTLISDGRIIDPIFDWHVTKNIFGRIMTLVEATTDTHKLKSVKDLFAKELRNWEEDVYLSAREIAKGGDSYSNIYRKNSIR